MMGVWVSLRDEQVTTLSLIREPWIDLSPWGNRAVMGRSLPCSELYPSLGTKGRPFLSLWEVRVGGPRCLIP
jgi:hypothetical protein